LFHLVEKMLAPYSDRSTAKFEIGGPAVQLKPKMALAISMILHELVTNAMKYGALSRPEGRIFVRWSVENRPDPWVHFSWREQGVTEVAPPSRQGFGSKLVEASARHELGGKVEINYDADGIRCEFEFPLTR
jgi:two-component sensor histidine kinase